MATLLELCDSGELVEVDVGLEADELPWRTIYATPAFIEWMDTVLGMLPGDPVHSDLTPHEQVFAALDDYVMGERFNDDRRFKTLSWTPYHGVWEIKTSDIRIFGWCPQRDTFICCYGDDKTKIKNLNLYGRYIAQTKYVIDNIDLGEPKVVMGRAYEDVISNKD